MKKIALCGNFDLCQELFQEFLNNKNFQVEFVITGVSKKFNRKKELVPNLLTVWAQKNNITCYEVEKFSSLDVELFNIDAVFVFSFGKLIPKKFLAAPKFGFLNLHPSNLPEFRGPSPVQFCILNEKQELTISLMQMNHEFDCGPIFAKKNIPFKLEYNLNVAFFLISLHFSWVVEQTLLFLQQKLPLIEQNSKNASYTKLISNENYYITNETPQEILAKIKAYGYVFFNFNNQLMKCFSAQINSNAKFQINGVEPIFVQMPGKKIMHVKHYQFH